MSSPASKPYHSTWSSQPTCGTLLGVPSASPAVSILTVPLLPAGSPPEPPWPLPPPPWPCAGAVPGAAGAGAGAAVAVAALAAGALALAVVAGPGPGVAAVLVVAVGLPLAGVRVLRPVLVLVLVLVPALARGLALGLARAHRAALTLTVPLAVASRSRVSGGGQGDRSEDCHPHHCHGCERARMLPHIHLSSNPLLDRTSLPDPPRPVSAPRGADMSIQRTRRRGVTGACHTGRASEDGSDATQGGHAGAVAPRGRGGRWSRPATGPESGLTCPNGHRGMVPRDYGRSGPASTRWVHRHPPEPAPPPPAARGPPGHSAAPAPRRSSP